MVQWLRLQAPSAEGMSSIPNQGTQIPYALLCGQKTPGSDSKASAYNTGDPGSIPGLGRSPGEGNGNPLQYSCLENLTDGAVVGCSPWGHKELDTPERLYFHYYI